METYTELLEFAENPDYQLQRQKNLGKLTDDMIDFPIVDIINGLNGFPYCFTLQSCYGHFVHNGQKNPHNLELLPRNEGIDKVEYRIAYIAFCIENSTSGIGFLEALKEITAIDPQNVQICCAEWFWKRQVNSYALQVEPERFKRKDKVILDYKEALHIEKIRNEFFHRFEELLKKQQKKMIS